MHRDLQDDSDSNSGNEVGGPPDPRHTIPKSPHGVRSARNNQLAVQPSPAEAPVSERPKDILSWKEGRLRSKPSQPAVEGRTSPGPLVALVNQIRRTNTIPNLQETIQELKARPYQTHALAESLHTRTPMQIDYPPARMFQAIPNLAREIEGSTFNEHLSRICHRMALADFYCAYRAAHAKPHVFLQELDRHPSQHPHRSRARLRTKRGEIKERFIELVFCQSTGERDRKKDSTRVNNWQTAGRPWFALINRFGGGILLLVPDEVTNRRLRDMKSSEFSNFLRLAEEREPVFKEVLAGANDLVKEGFQDHVSYVETAMSHSRNLLPSPPSGLKAPGSTASPVPLSKHGVWAGDACSGPELDTLLAYSFRQAAEGQQLNNIVHQCNLWPSTRFDDPHGVDELPNWSPRLQRSQTRPRCHQVLPFYDTGRWQLAVFDIVKTVVVYYDTMWTSGSPNSTFLSLQQWFDATVANSQEMVLDCHHEKHTPIANIAKETVILTWWFARQLIDINEVKSRYVDWRIETELADHVLSNGGQTMDPTIGLWQEELVSR